MTLPELATAILWLNQAPISRIRFTKTIYFVHKELVRKHLMTPEDITYLRLPLGPVPEGFMSLTMESLNIQVRPVSNHNLSYEAEEYVSAGVTSLQNLETNPPLRSAIVRTLAALNTHTTNELVKASYDPSWLTHPNGSRFHLSAADLKNTFPFSQIRIKIRLRRPRRNDIGALQATLLRGMIDDIVRESTDLEYPDTDQNTEQKPNKSSQ